ncbi:MAG TPA: hypothetical protein VL132_13720, partial [Planctomycetaceae bacterium]|nr:hypothetical protein [Planctomycetaceae bacterium]
MPSAPRPPAGKLREVAEKFVVLLGDKDGGAPTVDDEAPWLVPLSASLTAGGGWLDTLSFAVDLARAEIRLQDTTVPVGYHRQVELRRLDEDGEPTEIVAWGMIAANSQEIELREQVGITARVDRFVFGEVLTQSSYWDPIAETERRVHLPVVFNPEIDDKIEPNRSDQTDASRGDCHLFFHPESHRLQGAVDLQQQVADHWTLSEAAHWLIWNCNPEEKYITNPTLDDLQAAFAGHDEGQLKNFPLPFGRYLPELLDALLTPFGFGWYLVHTLDAEDDDARKTTFKFFRRGEGPKVFLWQQAPGATIDPVKTTVERISASYDITRLANVVVGRAGFKLYESTFPLIPGWEPGDDEQEFAKLDQGEELFKTYPFAYRKFVLNEAGDYNGTRPEITGHYPLIGDIGDSDLVIRRRKFQRCISEHTSDDDAESNGLVLEWWSSIQEGATSPTDPADPGWIRARWPFRLLEKECGILFTGPTPPQELYDLFQTGFDEVHLRLTASLESDYALESTAESRPSSPNGEDVTLFLGVKDRFHFREVTS